MKQLTICNIEQNQRLDKFLLKYLNKAPKSFVYKMLRKKNIVLNDKKALGSEIILEGDKIKLFFSDETINNFCSYSKISQQSTKQNTEQSKSSLNIVYEDENILICNKPSGVLSQPEKSNDNSSLATQIFNYLGRGGNCFTPSICNRLDRNTSGLVVCGKNLISTQCICKAFHDRLVDKYYLTVVSGKIYEKGVIKAFHLKDKSTNTVKILKSYVEGANEIITEYEPISFTENFTLLKVKLITGKTHQIRAHLKSINHCIVGDTKYGSNAINETLRKKANLKSQLLHAYKLTFNGLPSPLSYLNGLEFCCEVPKIFKKCSEMLLLE